MDTIALECSHCDYDLMHLNKVMAYKTNDDYEVKEFLEFDVNDDIVSKQHGSIEMKYRAREQSFSFRYTCEGCGLTTEYSLLFHKGHNFFTETNYFNNI